LETWAREHADGKTITFIATTSMPKSRVWHLAAKKIDVGDLSTVLEALVGKCIVPVEEPVEIEGVEMIGKPTQLRLNARAITSGHTLTLDPETLRRRKSKSHWSVEHQHGADPQTVAARWKDAGVLEQTKMTTRATRPRLCQLLGRSQGHRSVVARQRATGRRHPCLCRGHRHL
jgi:hypothetical protein